MVVDAFSRARAFVQAADLPEPPPIDFDTPKAPRPALDEAKEQAAVVGGEVIAFVRGVTREQRADIVNASLLAQLVAKKKVPSQTTFADVEYWYGCYFEVLSSIGFAIQDKGFAQYHEETGDFQAHEAILEVAAGLLVGAPAALTLVKTTLTALQKMSDGSPWITLFNRESQSANTARFQVGLAESSPTDGLLLTLMSFGLEAQSNLTQVLFFKFRKSDVTLRHHSGKVTVSAPVLEAVRLDIAERLVDFAQDYVRQLPDLA
ncbi:hypothetical protein [Terrabacter sp. Soil810]|uniref:hypothetical protein n=1 Tax=Terrabacter sp. Soil810 TaxID=1736418 RepID=UPI00070BC4E7|nr:hypothetical protein [Terrabacter sp. Soil810]KRF42159.1 hypothetical protein ASG96_22400 [Terrabacter sp. Soil810]